MAWFPLWSQKSCLMETMTCSGASTSQRRLVHATTSTCSPGWRCVRDAPSCLGPGCSVQGSVWSPRVPGGHTAEAQHGHCRTLLPYEVHPSAGRHGHRDRSEAHRPGFSSWWVSRPSKPVSHRERRSSRLALVRFQASASSLEVRARRRPPSTWTPSTRCPSIAPGSWPSLTAEHSRPLLSQPGRAKLPTRRLRRTLSSPEPRYERLLK